MANNEIYIEQNSLETSIVPKLVKTEYNPISIKKIPEFNI